MRASFDDTTVTVYQAYSPEIAEPAVAAGSFVPPFSLNRMTWIKPSFFWMMYRCGWATKPGQERVLAITITREGFEQALGEACLSHYDPQLYATPDDWARRKEASPVRVQWDPERSRTLQPLPWRSLQLGLSGTAARMFVCEWIMGLEDITDLVHALAAQTGTGAREHAVPEEAPYPLPAHLAQIIGAA